MPAEHRFEVAFEREDDGRWIAEIAALPGVMAYGDTQEQALVAVQALALRVLAERLERGEVGGVPLALSFVAA